jgi:hypothetical protein
MRVQIDPYLAFVSIEHECQPTPSSIQKGYWMCLKCIGFCRIEMADRFRKSIESIGGRTIGQYKDAHTPVPCICPNGHKCQPIPSNIHQGEGICRKCTKKCPEEAEKNFIVSITAMEGKIVGQYEGANTPVPCICSKGHKCTPTPSSIQQGHWMCFKCRPSYGELLLSKCFEALGVVPDFQAKLSEYQRYSYDAYAIYKGKHIYAEHDDIQHFEEANFYNRGKDSMKDKQSRDITKTKLIVEKYRGCMIRHTYNVLKCEEKAVISCFIKAVEMNYPLLYVDADKNNVPFISRDNKMYSWLTEQVSIPSKQSRLDIEDGLISQPVRQSRLDIEN